MVIKSHNQAIQAIKVSSIPFFCIGLVQTIYWLVFQNMTFRIEGIILLSLAVFLFQKKSIIASIGLFVFSVFVVIVINKNISNIILSLSMVYLSIIAIRATIYVRKESKRKKNSVENLTNRLIKQRNMWLKSVSNYLSNNEIEEDNYKLNFKSALPIVTAFQIKHNVSFINMKKYVEEKKMEDFVAKFIDNMSAEFKSDEWVPYLSNYEDNNKKDLGEQLSIFCEDVSVAILKSNSGMLYGTAFVSMARDFLVRNQGIVADSFGDKETLKQSAEIIKKSMGFK